MSDFKNILTNIIAFLFPLIEPVNSWLISGEPFNWRLFVASCLAAVVAYYTGKDKNGKAKIIVNDKIVPTEPRKNV